MKLCVFFATNFEAGVLFDEVRESFLGLALGFKNGFINCGVAPSTYSSVMVRAGGW